MTEQYSYAALRPEVFTEKGQIEFLKVRDKAKDLLRASGAFTAESAFPTGDPWLHLACIERLVELGELVEVKNTSSGLGQHRLFVALRSAP